MAQPAVNDVLTWDGTKGVYAPNPALSLALTDTYIFVGNSIGVATGVPLTLNDEPGPFALGNTGILTMPDASVLGRGLLNAADWTTVGFLHNDGSGNLQWQAVSGAQDLAATLAIGNATGGLAITSDDAGTELRVFDSNKGYFINSVGVVGITNEAFVNPNRILLATAGAYVGHNTLVSLSFDNGSQSGTYLMNATASASVHSVLISDTAPSVSQQTPILAGRYGVNAFTNSTAIHGIVLTGFTGFDSYVSHSVTQMLLKQSSLIAFDAPQYSITNIVADSYLYVDSGGFIVAGATPITSVPGLATVLGVSGVTGDQAIKSANNKSQLFVYNAGSSLSYIDGSETTSHTVNSGAVGMTYDNASTLEAGHISMSIAGTEILHNVAVQIGYDDGGTVSAYSGYTPTQARLTYYNATNSGGISVTDPTTQVDHTIRLDLNAPTVIVTCTDFGFSYTNPGRALITDPGTGYVVVSAVTSTELGYVSGATSPLQAQIDALVSGLSWKQAVRVRTTANITLSGTQTIDGVAVIVGDRVLVMSQTDPKENGIYVCAAGAWSRSTDANTGAELLSATVATQEGTLYADKQYVCTTDAPITIGVSNITFVLVGGTTYVGTTDRITVTGNVIDIAATYLGQTSITTLGTVTTGTWNATAINFAYIASMSSANLAGIITDETGFSSGAVLVFSKSPTIEAPTVSGVAVFSGVINESKGADIASAGTTDIGAATGNYVNVTGTTTITALGTVQAGTRRIVNFNGALTLTYNATSLILPGNANITTAAGDIAEFVSLGSGNWVCTSYQSRASLIVSQSYTFDGQGSVIAVGSQSTIEWVNSGTIIGWTLLEVSNTPVSSSIVIDAWKDTYAAYPPVVGDSIFGTKPALSSAIKNTASGLSIAVTAGDIMKANVDSVTSALKVKLIFHLLVHS